MHSTVGCAAAVLTAAQYVAAGVLFLWPRPSSAAARAALVRPHALLGFAAFGGAVAAALMGLQEKATFVQTLGHAEPGSGALNAPRAIAIAILVAAAAALYAFGQGGSGDREAAGRASDAEGAAQPGEREGLL